MLQRDRVVCQGLSRIGVGVHVADVLLHDARCDRVAALQVGTEGFFVVRQCPGGIAEVVVHIGDRLLAERHLLRSSQRFLEFQRALEVLQCMGMFPGLAVSGADRVEGHGHAGTISSQFVRAQRSLEVLHGMHLVAAIVGHPAQISEGYRDVLLFSRSLEVAQCPAEVRLRAVQLPLLRKEPAHVVVRIAQGLRVPDAPGQGKGLFAVPARAVRIGGDEVEANARQGLGTGRVVGGFAQVLAVVGQQFGILGGKEQGSQQRQEQECGSHTGENVKRPSEDGLFQAVRTGLEPATSDVTGRHSNQAELPDRWLRVPPKAGQM